jgi:signal peptidase II
MKKNCYYLISFLLIIFDQLSKAYIRGAMLPGETFKVTPKFLWITYVQNPGAAFSFSLGEPQVNRIFFSIVSFLAVILLIYLIKKSGSKLEKTGFSLVLAGAGGNLIDRILLGEVTDFINCDFPDFIMERWPVFNVADSSVVIGVILLAIYYLLLESRVKRDITEQKS